jgi:hypothetical protein
MDSVKTAQLILDAAILDLEGLIAEDFTGKCFEGCVKNLVNGIRNSPEKVKSVVLFGPARLFEGMPEYDLLSTLQKSLYPLEINEVQVPEGLNNGELEKFCSKYRRSATGERKVGVYCVYLDYKSLCTIGGQAGRFNGS